MRLNARGAQQEPAKRLFEFLEIGPGVRTMATALSLRVVAANAAVVQCRSTMQRTASGDESKPDLIHLTAFCHTSNNTSASGTSDIGMVSRWSSTSTINRRHAPKSVGHPNNPAKRVQFRRALGRHCRACQPISPRWVPSFLPETIQASSSAAGIHLWRKCCSNARRCPRSWAPITDQAARRGSTAIPPAGFLD